MSRGWVIGLFIAAAAGAAAADEAGPRGTVGPDAPLSRDEETKLAPRVAVPERHAQAIRETCERAVREGARAVFLPAGEYRIESTVRVPAGLTIIGAGSGTVLRAGDRKTRLFAAGGDGVRFTRLKLEGADASIREDNDTYGIAVAGSKNIRIDHCELSGFSYATSFSDEATAQVDHCFIHHNLRDGLGYGVALYSGAYVLVIDNEFSQNRHSLASNGALDWGSGERLGKYVHKPGVRKTHWEFIHNRVRGDNLTRFQLCAVDTHPGMDGTFVAERNLFEEIRHGVGIRDGAGLIRGNVFRRLRADKGREAVGISVAYGTHNNIPVEGTMPRDIRIEGNTFLEIEEKKFVPCRIGKAENVTVDGKLVPETRVEGRAPAEIPRLKEMGADGVLRMSPEQRD